MRQSDRQVIKTTYVALINEPIVIRDMNKDNKNPVNE